jgi:hypothetical protein
MHNPETGHARQPFSENITRTVFLTLRASENSLSGLFFECIDSGQNRFEGLCSIPLRPIWPRYWKITGNLPFRSNFQHASTGYHVPEYRFGG